MSNQDTHTSRPTQPGTHTDLMPWRSTTTQAAARERNVTNCKVAACFTRARARGRKTSKTGKTTVLTHRAHGHEELSTINPYSIGGVCFTHGIKHRKSRRLEHPRTRTQTYALRRLGIHTSGEPYRPIHYGIHAHDGVMKRDATRSP